MWDSLSTDLILLHPTEIQYLQNRNIASLKSVINPYNELFWINFQNLLHESNVRFGQSVIQSTMKRWATIRVYLLPIPMTFLNGSSLWLNGTNSSPSHKLICPLPATPILDPAEIFHRNQGKSKKRGTL